MASYGTASPLVGQKLSNSHFRSFVSVGLEGEAVWGEGACVCGGGAGVGVDMYR